MCHVGFPGLHSQILNKSVGEDLEMQEALNLTSSRGLFAVCIKTTKTNIGCTADVTSMHREPIIIFFI